jgi:hypothetical protein
VDWGELWRKLLGSDVGEPAGDDVLALGVMAVMREAKRFGQNYILPDHVVYTLPAEEFRLFSSPPLREGLIRSLQAEVNNRKQTLFKKLRSNFGTEATVTGGDLLVTLHEGSELSAEARFESRPGTPPSGPEEPGYGTEFDPGVTVAYDEPHLVLRSDGVVLATAPLRGEVVVGRAPQATLTVPDDKTKVSRVALVVRQRPNGTVGARVDNLNGVWVRRDRPHEAASGRDRIPRHDEIDLRPGERVDLDREATVTVSIEPGQR